MEKQFLCEECGLLFSHKPSLLRHVKNIHRGMKRKDNETRKAANKKIADKICDMTIQEVIMKYNPTEAICFHFVRNTPWTEDMKRKAEESFEEIFRACDKTFVFVEYESTEENVTEEAKLVVTEKMVSQLEL